MKQTDDELIIAEQRAEKHYQQLSRLFEFELKYIYYLLGVAVAILGFTIVSTKDIVYLHFWGLWGCAIGIIAFSSLFGLLAVKRRNQTLMLISHHTICIFKAKDLISRIEGIEKRLGENNISNDEFSSIEKAHLETTKSIEKIEKDLEEAIAKGFFYYHLQPIFLLAGIALYFTWHVTTLCSKGVLGTVVFPCLGTLCQ